MGDIVLISLIVRIFPAFEKHWEQDVISHDASDKDPTAHQVMDSFFSFYINNFASFSRQQTSLLCNEFEEIVSNDPNDADSNANAICTMFLELLVDTPPGQKIEPYLGTSCKKYWNCYKS